MAVPAQNQTFCYQSSGLHTQSCAEKFWEIINYVSSPEDEALTVGIHNKHLLVATQREKM